MEVETESHRAVVASDGLGVVLQRDAVAVVLSPTLSQVGGWEKVDFRAFLQHDLVRAETVVVDTYRDPVGEEATDSHITREGAFGIVAVVITSTLGFAIFAGDEEQVVANTEFSIRLDDVGHRVTVLSTDVDRHIDVLRIGVVGLVKLSAESLVGTVPEAVDFDIRKNLTILAVVDGDTVAETESETEHIRRVVHNILSTHQTLRVTHDSASGNRYFSLHSTRGETAGEGETKFELCVSCKAGEAESCSEH